MLNVTKPSSNYCFLQNALTGRLLILQEAGGERNWVGTGSTLQIASSSPLPYIRSICYYIFQSNEQLLEQVWNPFRFAPSWVCWIFRSPISISPLCDLKFSSDRRRSESCWRLIQRNNRWMQFSHFRVQSTNTFAVVAINLHHGRKQFSYFERARAHLKVNFWSAILDYYAVMRED